MKETSGNWVRATTRFAPLQTMGMVGATDSESEEAEEAEEAEQIDNSLDARLERAAAEPDFEREEIFRYLKEFRRQKRRGQRLERQVEAREEMRVEMDQVLQADAERSARESEGAMAKNPGVGIEYVEDANGKLVKKRAARSTPAANVDDDGTPYVRNANGELVPADSLSRQFTAEDLKRVNQTRDQRHGQRWWLKRLQAISEGTETVTREQLSAHMAIGRSKGWTRRPSNQR